MLKSQFGSNNMFGLYNYNPYNFDIMAAVELTFQKSIIIIIDAIIYITQYLIVIECFDH